jgi:hypothetical protein
MWDKFKDHKVKLAHKAQQVTQDPRAILEIQDPQVLQVQLDPWEPLAHKALLATLVTLDPLEKKAQLVQQDHRALLATQVPLVILEQLAPRVLQELQVLRAFKAFKATQVPLVILEPPALLVHKA